MNGNVVYLVLVINRYGVMSVTDFDAFKKQVMHNQVMHNYDYKNECISLVRLHGRSKKNIPVR